MFYLFGDLFWLNIGKRLLWSNYLNKMWIICTWTYQRRWNSYDCSPPLVISRLPKYSQVLRLLRLFNNFFRLWIISCASLISLGSIHPPLRISCHYRNTLNRLIRWLNTSVIPYNYGSLEMAKINCTCFNSLICRWKRVCFICTRIW